MVEQQQAQLELPKAEEMEAMVVVALPQVVAVVARVELALLAQPLTDV
jgi:hypothetical protein